MTSGTIAWVSVITLVSFSRDLKRREARKEILKQIVTFYNIHQSKWQPYMVYQMLSETWQEDLVKLGSHLLLEGRMQMSWGNNSTLMLNIKETLLPYKHRNSTQVFFGTMFQFPSTTNMTSEIWGEAKIVCTLGHLDKPTWQDLLRLTNY